LNQFKEKLNAGESVLGPFMKTSDPAFVESAGYAGFDFVILDMEHGPVNIENMQNNIRAAVLSGAVPIIRVENTDESNIGKALDIGSFGIQIPQIENAKQAESVIKKAKFHPSGKRGVCRFVRAANYSVKDRNEYFQEANENLIIIQLEGIESLENIDKILAVEGIDIIFIGPYDLSQSLGVPGQTSHSLVLEKMQYIVNKAKEQEIIIGTFVDEIDDILKWKKAGVQYISYSVDVGIFADACKKIININN
jgi:4-hydroxy-2-oxoheptanedioate aldolase